MTTSIDRRYRRLRSAGWRAGDALRHCRDDQRLAQAENAGRISFHWTDDWDLGLSHAEFFSTDAYPTGEPTTCESCMAFLPGPHFGNPMIPNAAEWTYGPSLGCIDDADDDYRRSVEIGLAYDAGVI